MTKLNHKDDDPVKPYRELLRECVAQIETTFQNAIGAPVPPCARKARALLAEPEADPEYVWRVTTEWSPGNTEEILCNLREDAEFYMSESKSCLASLVTIERAPIGPWEAVSDE